MSAPQYTIASDQIGTFVDFLFRYADEDSFISLRAFDQVDRGKPPVLIESVAVGADMKAVVQRAAAAAALAANHGAPAVFAPPVATFNNPRTARSMDVANGVAISVEIDAGDPDEARRALERILGPVTIAIHSGGEWADPATGEIHPKTHMHWRLSEPTSTLEDHAKLQDARWLAAVLVGGDKTAAPPAHPLRWPGSWNFKSIPRQARIATGNQASEVHLEDALARLQEAVEAAGFDRSANTGERVSSDPQAPLELISEAILAIPNLDAEWDEWNRIGMAAWRASGGSAAGLEAWLEWSGKSDKHDPAACEARWQHFGTSPPTRIGAGTIFHLARIAGWQRPGDDHEEPPPHSALADDIIAQLTALGVEDGGEPNEPPPVLSAASPVNSARSFIGRLHASDGQRTLLHRQSSFYTWAQSHYVERDAEEIRATLYGFLHGARTETAKGEIEPFNPTKRKVADVLEATAAEAQLDRQHQAPCWLSSTTDPQPPAPEIISCANGLLHIPTSTMIDHTPAFFTTNALTFDYQADAPEPKEWLKFLRTIWPDDQQAIEVLQEFFGLALTADTKFQKALLIIGPRRSGKGTVARILTQLLGQANVASPTLSALATNFGIAPLIWKRLAIISDARLSGKADQQQIAERLLSITGEDGQTIDRKNKPHWTGKLDVRFLVLTNELPRISDSSGALASRFIILRMTETFFGREDLGLLARLEPELPSILLWAIAGWKRLTERGHFIPPKSSAAAVQELEDLSSPIGAFLRAHCIVGAGHSMRCEDMYDTWCDWCRAQGRDHAGTVQGLARDLGTAIPGLATIQRRDEKTGKRHRYFEGVGFDPQNIAAVSRAVTRDSSSQPQHYRDDPGPTCADLEGI